jgi:N-acetylglucosamine-6-phosphate deacetylase
MGFFDLQVNGYGGVDLNGDELEGEQLEGMCALLSSHGVDGILATLITDTLEKMKARLRRLCELRRQSAKIAQMIRGVHLEGPFISPESGFRGAHPLDAILCGDRGTMEDLLESGEGLVRLVTLAPECDPGLAVTRMLADRKIVISAGHTNASVETLRAAIDAGLTMFTHLGNGCPAMLPRHDNIVQRVLSLRERLWLCMIADGAHIPLFALRNYLDLVGYERVIIVTDGISASGLGPGNYRFGRWNLKIGEDLVARADDGSHLVGSTTTMRRSLTVLTKQLGVPKDAARRLLSQNSRSAVHEPPGD